MGSKQEEVRAEKQATRRAIKAALAEMDLQEMEAQSEFIMVWLHL
jgi:hypothetical protein